MKLPAMRLYASCGRAIFLAFLFRIRSRFETVCLSSRGGQQVFVAKQAFFEGANEGSFPADPIVYEEIPYLAPEPGDDKIARTSFSLASAFPDFDDCNEIKLVNFSQKCAEMILSTQTLALLPDNFKAAAQLALSDTLALRLRAFHAINKMVMTRPGSLVVYHGKGTFSHSLVVHARGKGRVVTEKGLTEWKGLITQAIMMVAKNLSAAWPNDIANILDRLFAQAQSQTSDDVKGRLLVIVDDRELSRYWTSLRAHLDDVPFAAAPFIVSINNAYTAPIEKIPKEMALKAAFSATTVIRRLINEGNTGFDKEILVYLFPTIMDFIRKKLPRLAAISGAAAAHLQANPTGVLVAPGRHPVSFSYITQARNSGVRTFDYQPIMFAAIPRYLKPRSDICFVVDDAQAKIARDHFGVPGDRLVPLGSCRLTESAPPLPDRSSVLPTVLLVCQPLNISMFCDIIRVLCEASKNGTEFVIKISPHPNDAADHIARYQDVLKQAGAGDWCEIVPKGETVSLVLISKVIVTLFSNVGYDAAIAGRTVIAVTGDGLQGRTELDILGDLVLKADLSKLAETVHRSLTVEMDENIERQRIALFEKFHYLRPGASRAIFCSHMMHSELKKTRQHRKK